MKFRWRLFGFFAIFYSLLVAVPSPYQDETEARFRFTLKGGEGTATRWLNFFSATLPFQQASFRHFTSTIGRLLLATIDPRFPAENYVILKIL